MTAGSPGHARASQKNTNTVANEAGTNHSTGADGAGEVGRDAIRSYLDAVFGDDSGFAVFALIPSSMLRELVRDNVERRIDRKRCDSLGSLRSPNVRFCSGSPVIMLGVGDD